MRKIIFILLNIFILLCFSGCSKSDKQIREEFFNKIDDVQTINDGQIVNEIYFEIPKEKKALTYLVEDISNMDEKYAGFIKIISTNNNNNFNYDIYIKTEKNQEYIELTNIIHISETNKLYIKTDNLKNISIFTNQISKETEETFTKIKEKNINLNIDDILNILKFLPKGYIEFDSIKDKIDLSNQEQNEIKNLFLSYFTSCFKLIEGQYKDTLIKYDKKKDIHKISLDKNDINKVIETFKLINKDNFIILMENLKEIKEMEFDKLEQLNKQIYEVNIDSIPEDSKLDYTLKTVKKENIYNYGQNFTYTGNKYLLSFSIIKTNNFEEKIIEKPKDLTTLESMFK